MLSWEGKSRPEAVRTLHDNLGQTWESTQTSDSILKSGSHALQTGGWGCGKGGPLWSGADFSPPGQQSQTRCGATGPSPRTGGSAGGPGAPSLSQAAGSRWQRSGCSCYSVETGKTDRRGAISITNLSLSCLKCCVAWELISLETSFRN